MANTNLRQAKASKNDEFYTQFSDIEAEVNSYLCWMYGYSARR